MSNKPNRLPETLNDYPPQSSRARGTLEPIPQEDARNGGRASVPRAASGGSGQIQGAGAPGVSRRASPHSVPSPRQRFVGGSESAGKSRTHLGRRAVDPLRRDAGAAAAAAATATAPAAGARPALGGPWRARGSGRRAPRPPRRRRASARQVLAAAPELPLPSPPPPPLPPAPAPRLHFKQVR